jgi:WD40 repeat protein
VTVSQDGIAILWDMQTEIEIRRFNGVSTIFSPDGTMLIYATYRSNTLANTSQFVELVFSDAITGQETQRYRLHGSQVVDLVYDAENETMLVNFDVVKRELIDAITGATINSFSLVSSDNIIAATTTADRSRTVVLTLEDPDVAVYDNNAGDRIHLLQGHTDGVTTALFSHDGRHYSQVHGIALASCEIRAQVRFDIASWVTIRRHLWVILAPMIV